MWDMDSFRYGKIVNDFSLEEATEQGCDSEKLVSEGEER